MQLPAPSAVPSGSVARCPGRYISPTRTKPAPALRDIVRRRGGGILRTFARTWSVAGGRDPQDRDGGADRRRRPGRADAGDGSRLARRRRSSSPSCAAAASRRASSATTSRRARWRSSAASASRRSARRRPAGGLPERRRLPHRRRPASSWRASRSPAAATATPRPAGRTPGGRRPSRRTASTRSTWSRSCSRTPRPCRASRILNRTAVERLRRRTTSGVVATARDLDTGETAADRARYLVGCDGGRSVVRTAIGASLHGDDGRPARAVDLHPRAGAARHAARDGRPGRPLAQPAPLRQRLRHRRARDLAGAQLPAADEADFDAVDRDWAHPRRSSASAPDFEYEVLSKEDWIGRRLVADRFRDRRVFICGDAAHIWVPYAGYGMNAGIADAANLAWLLAARAQRLGGAGASSTPTRPSACRSPSRSRTSRWTTR